MDPYIVVDHPDADDKGIGVGTPYLWTAPDGKMWLFYMQQGIWAIVFDGADGDLSRMSWDIRQISANYQLSKKPIVIEGENGREEWFMTVYNANDKGVTYSYVSGDNGESWQIRGTAKSDSPYRKYVEACYAQLSDKSLLQICRLDNGGGGLEVSRSYDFGKTWSAFVCNLEEPYWGPGSKPDLLTLADGGLLMINHDNKNSRSGLTAYLSYDDGESWPYRLSLDERGGVTADYFDGVAYPEAYQDENGDIYVIYDRDRWDSCEIRLAKFTVDDVKAGRLIKQSSFVKMPIFKKRNSRISSERKPRLKRRRSIRSALRRKRFPADCRRPYASWTIRVRRLPSTEHGRRRVRSRRARRGNSRLSLRAMCPKACTILSIYSRIRRSSPKKRRGAAVKAVWRLKRGCFPPLSAPPRWV